MEFQDEPSAKRAKVQKTLDGFIPRADHGERRYTDASISGFLLQASALDPRFKSLPYLDDSARRDVYDSVQTEVQKLVENKYMSQNVTVKQEPNETPSTNATTAVSQSLTLPTLPELEEGEPPVKIKKETDMSERKCSGGTLADLFGDVFVTKVEPAKSFLEKIRAEIVFYKEEDCLSLESEQSDPLLWWRGKQEKYPILSKYAKQLLGIPATSVTSERVFSTAGDVVTAQRACLTGDQVDMLVFLKQNINIPNDLL